MVMVSDNPESDTDTPPPSTRGFHHHHDGRGNTSIGDGQPLLWITLCNGALAHDTMGICLDYESWPCGDTACVLNVHALYGISLGYLISRALTTKPRRLTIRGPLEVVSSP